MPQQTNMNKPSHTTAILMKRQFAILLLTIMIGFSLTYWVYKTVQGSELQNTSYKFNMQVEDHVWTIKRELDFALRPSTHIANQLRVNEAVRETLAFRKLVSTIPLSRHPGVRVLGWIPRVKAEQRNAFESKIQHPITVFQHDERDTTDPSKQAPLEPAPTNGEYYPILLAEPFSPDGYPLAYDARSAPELWHAMQRASKSGKPAATVPLPLLKKKGRGSGFMVFKPVFAKGNPHGKGELQGFAFGLIDMKLIDIKTIRENKIHGINIEVFDITDPDRHQLMHHHITEEHAHTDSAALSPSPVKSFQVAANVVDRNWLFVVSPKDGVFLPNRKPEMVVLASGLSFTALLCLYLFSLIQRNQKSAILTTQLRSSNQNLKAEINERKTAEKNLAHQSLHDSLTGLPNREMLMQTLQRVLAQSQRHDIEVAILFIDLDDFKLVNDTLGHQAGDELLQQVTERFLDATRKSDLLIRQGGDEFILLMTSRGLKTNPTCQSSAIAIAASSTAERIIHSLKEPFIIIGQPTYVEASIGISLAPNDANNGTTLLQHADSAMYKAKELGGAGYCFYSQELYESQQNRLFMVTQLHKAIEQQTFFLEYQPVVDLSNGEMVSTEALIRWRDDNGELISPAKFIPVAEDSGLILTIGDWVMEEACHQLHQWQDQEIILQIAVNISARQLWQHDLPEKIIEIIDRIGVNRSALEIEVTETAIIQDPVRMEESLLRFSEEGLRISLDDFGTGYSSLDRLKKLPISKIKIDQSFVAGIPEDKDDVSIVTAIIQLSRSLGLPTLAEGVETEEQYRFLRDMGCEFGQGFYFSRSVSSADIEAMYRKKQCWPLEP